MFDILLDEWKHPSFVSSPLVKVKLPLEKPEEELSRLHKCGVDSVLIYTDEASVNTGMPELLEAAKKRFISVTVHESCIEADCGFSDKTLLSAIPPFREKVLKLFDKNEALGDFDEVLCEVDGKNAVITDGEERVDLLNPDAAESYIYGTYENFAEKYKPYLGGTITGVYTDRLRDADLEGLVWSYEMAEELDEAGADENTLYNLLSPEAKMRDRREAFRIYRIAVAYRMAKSFTYPLYRLCSADNIDLLGTVPYEMLSSSGQYFTSPVVEAAPKDAPSLEEYLKAVGDISRHGGGKGTVTEVTPSSFEEFVSLCEKAAMSTCHSVIVPSEFFSESNIKKMGMTPTDCKRGMEYISRVFSLLSAVRLPTDVMILTEDGTVPTVGGDKLAALGFRHNYVSKDQLFGRGHIHDSVVHMDKYEYGTVLLDPRVRLTPTEVKKIGEFAAMDGRFFRGSAFDDFAKKHIPDSERNEVVPGVRRLEMSKCGISFTLLMNTTESTASVNLSCGEKTAYLMNGTDGTVQCISDGGEVAVSIPALSLTVISYPKKNEDGLPVGEPLKRGVPAEIISLKQGDNPLPRPVSEGDIAEILIDSLAAPCKVTAGKKTVKLTHRPYQMTVDTGVESICLECDGEIKGARIEIRR